MLKAIAVTFIIFAIIFSGIIALKRTANQWKVPKGVKSQPYDDEKDYDEESDKQNEEDSKKNNQSETPQLEDQSDSKQKTDSQDKK